MELTKSFDVDQPADVVARIAARDDTLLRLFEPGETEIISRDGNRQTVRTHYTALGRKGVATFEFLFSGEGSIQFEKVCDGNVWRKLEGIVSFSNIGKGKGGPGQNEKGQSDRGTRVTLQMTGKTKTLVPELAIRVPMQEQLEQMTDALRACLEAGDEV